MSTKHEQIQYEIYTKIKLACMGEVTHSNVCVLVTMAMYLLNKHELLGNTKKRLCTEVIVLLMSEGVPELVSVYTLDVIQDMIELVYSKNYHRRGGGKSKCVLM